MNYKVSGMSIKLLFLPLVHEAVDHGVVHRVGHGEPVDGQIDVLGTKYYEYCIMNKSSRGSENRCEKLSKFLNSEMRTVLNSK